jgi:hypothetical protein
LIRADKRTRGVVRLAEKWALDSIRPDVNANVFGVAS